MKFCHGRLVARVFQAGMVSVRSWLMTDGGRTAVASALAVPAGFESDHVRFAMVEALQ